MWIVLKPELPFQGTMKQKGKFYYHHLSLKLDLAYCVLHLTVIHRCE